MKLVNKFPPLVESKHGPRTIFLINCPTIFLEKVRVKTEFTVILYIGLTCTLFRRRRVQCFPNTSNSNSIFISFTYFFPLLNHYCDKSLSTMVRNSKDSVHRPRSRQSSSKYSLRIDPTDCLETLYNPQLSVFLTTDLSISYGHSCPDFHRHNSRRA